MVLPTVGWVLLYQSSIKIIFHRHCHRPICSGQPLNWEDRELLLMQTDCLFCEDIRSASSVKHPPPRPLSVSTWSPAFGEEGMDVRSGWVTGAHPWELYRPSLASAQRSLLQSAAVRCPAILRFPRHRLLAVAAFTFLPWWAEPSQPWNKISP